MTERDDNLERAEGTYGPFSTHGWRRLCGVPTLCGLLVLAGCKPVGPNYTRPQETAPPAYKEAGASTAIVPPPNPQGGSWQPASPSDGMLRGKWWEAFNDPELNRLEELVTPQNQTLRAATETYLAARDQVRTARASFFRHFLRGRRLRGIGYRRTGRWRLPGAVRPTTILYLRGRQAGNRISGAGCGARWKRHVRVRRPAAPIWRTSI